VYRPAKFTLAHKLAAEAAGARKEVHALTRTRRRVGAVAYPDQFSLEHVGGEPDELMCIGIYGWAALQAKTRCPFVYVDTS